MRGIEPLLKKLADAQVKRPEIFIATAVVITAIMLVSIGNVRLEGDIMAQMPQDLDAFKDEAKLTSRFGGTDSVMMLIYLNPEKSSTTAVRDIRDPRVIKTLIDLDSLLREESAISDIISPAMVFRQTGVPETTEGVKQILSAFPQAGGFFSDDYSAVIVYLKVDVGTAPEKINRLSESLKDKVEKLAPPPGVKISETGTPQIIAMIMELLEQDALYTIMLAIFFISIFLIVVFRARGALTITPIILAASWMYGTMAWFDIPLSVATAGVGAMILGLSVEYDVFFVERFKEEYDKLNSYDDALRSALPKVGVSIIGSSLTTMTGFFALMLSIMPMLQNLGLTLGLGIFYSVIVDIVFNPVNVLVAHKSQKNFREWRIKRSMRNLEENGILGKNEEGYYLNGGYKDLRNRGLQNNSKDDRSKDR